MSTFIALEKTSPALPAVAREKLATLTWESLQGDSRLLIRDSFSLYHNGFVAKTGRSKGSDEDDLSALETMPKSKPRQAYFIAENMMMRYRVCPLLLVFALIAIGIVACSDREVFTLTAGLAGPSVVSTHGRQLLVRRRNPDGTLAPATPYIIRGVNWSPASRETQTSPTDSNNTNVRRPEFNKWAATDIPLIADMNVNTVRLFIDPGFDQTLGPMGLAILDKLYSKGIMAIMTVDDGINDLDRVRQAVNFYKDHPAILIWILGSEWNLNRYFGVASSIQDAAQRTETAAALIKTLDPNHPVAASYGEINIDANGLRLSDMQGYVNTVCPSVDVWGLNIYRGNIFGTLFNEWASITTKPMFLGEFGTDAFRTTDPTSPPQGVVDEAMQAQWDLSLWSELFGHLSASDSSRVALGGTVFAWNDEWWKDPPAGSQQAGGFLLPHSHPDNFANEEYWGVVTIDRKKRRLYDTLKTAFDPAFSPLP